MDFDMMDGLIGLIALIVIALIVVPMIARSDRTAGLTPEQKVIYDLKRRAHSSLWNLAQAIGMTMIVIPFVFGGAFKVGSTAWTCTTILLIIAVLATIKFGLRDAPVRFRALRHASHTKVKANSYSTNRPSLYPSSR